MKQFLKISLLILSPILLNAQQNIDSLKKNLENAGTDSIRYQVYGKLADFYIEKKIDSALFFIQQCLNLSQKNHKKLNEAASLNAKALGLRHMGQYSESLQCLLEAFDIANDASSEQHFWPLPAWIFAPGKDAHTSRLIVIANIHMQMANLFIRTGNDELCVYHFAEANTIGEQTRSYYFLYYLYITMGIAYKNMGKPDSAMLIEQKALSLANQFGYKENTSRIVTYIGEIHFARMQIDTALKYYQQALPLAIEEKNFVSQVMIYFGLSKCFLAQREKDSSLLYGKKALETLNQVRSLAGTTWNKANAYENLFRIFKLRNETDSAYKCLELALRAKDSLNANTVKSSARAQDLFFHNQIRLSQLEADKIEYRNRVTTYSFLAGIVILLLLVAMLYRNYRNKLKAKNEIEKSYHELRATQAQLVQKEKMASLGELTAGIAHEIQNPLNFVNNFSEVSVELIGEMEEQLQKDKKEEALIIATDLKENLEKITEHGNRASSIIKGMLQHSRKSTDKKELTDINALADEYVRLSYHAMRAKDKTFYAVIETNFDESIGSIEVIPQDIGRVLLNLLNNAFYAVNEKKKQLNGTFEPIVQVTTTKTNKSIEIKVKDNGNGVPKKILDKIYQPFFTTKPTGHGTGLGLSISYDIIKAHGGELKVETKEGEGSTFSIVLPLNPGS